MAGNGGRALAHVRSFGCLQNVSDGEKIKGQLSVMGFDFTEDLNCADLIIYNTCAVRESAEAKVFGLIGELTHLKAKNPALVIALCGCMAEESAVVEKIRKTYSHIDIVFGTSAIGQLPRLLQEAYDTKERVFCSKSCDELYDEGLVPLRDGGTKATVPIMYGCNNFCSYCIVPYVRGRERSRAPAAVIKEVRGLVAEGYKEIMLLGQNVNSYNGDGIGFSELLRCLNDIDGDFKLRFMSSHPKDAGIALIDAILDCDKVAKHLHLPVQSGSDRILAAMNRGYTVGKYLEVVDYARSRNADFSFSSDIIVGFPNESREDFLMTKALVERVKFDSLYTFIYSKRTGTVAAQMVDSTAQADKTAWLRELLATQREISTEYYRRFIGRTLTVLAEGSAKTAGMLIGKSDEFIIVEFEAPPSEIGRFVQVNITDAHNWALVGKIL